MDLDQGLAPGFLVAAPALRDPNFAGSLVLMAQHEEEGSLGFVVNRLAPVSAGEVLEAIDPALRQSARRLGRDGAAVLVGGPVQPGRVWILYHPGPGVPEEGLTVVPGFAAGGSRELIEVLAREPSAGPFQIVLGYAGWGPLQVEHEVAAGAWIPLPFAEDLLFGVAADERWSEAVRRLGLTPGFALGGEGGAQA
jgi:putative transcriptional regulator